MTKADKYWYDLQNSLLYGMVLTAHLRIELKQQWVGTLLSILFVLNVAWTVYYTVKWAMAVREANGARRGQHV